MGLELDKYIVFSRESQHMSHSIDFFRDEVRNGFYIPTAVKQAWASCLDVLREVDRVCTKYGIKYFADWGSFLGAVRHGGFVPWDDDLDICMLRDDYIKFRKVCDKELPKHYVIHDYERKEDHWLFLSRVVSNASICFDEDYMAKHYNFPWLATVDIFVKDYLYMDEEKERARDKEVLFLITLADGIREGKFDRNTSLYHLQKIKEKYHTSLPDIGRTRELCVALYRLAENEMAKVKPEETGTVGQIFPWILKGGKGQPKAYYEKIIRLPFEDTTIPVPACYNTVLASRYGNYNEIHKVWNGHMYPFFEGQKADLEKINGAPLPGKVFDIKLLERPEVDRSNSLKAIADECLQEHNRLYDELATYKVFGENGHFITQNNYTLTMSSEDIASIEEILTASQQLAIDLGTLIEQVKGEERECTKAVVGALENYCEAIFQCFQSISGVSACSDSDNSSEAISIGFIYGQSDGNGQKKDNEGACTSNIEYQNALDKLEESLNQVCSITKEYIIDCKEVLFLPIGPREWNGLEKIYQYYESLENSVSEHNFTDRTYTGGDGKYDIYVVPLPLLTKDPLGQVAVSEELIKEGLKIEQYPAGITYTDWQNYDITQHCPDIIYIQNPYDAENPYLTVPPQYYASNIRKYTEKLIFIPFKDTGEFDEKDGPDIYNLKHYAAASGVICSDMVIVQSEKIKQHYVNALAKFAGEDTRDIWEHKIVVREKTYCDQSSDSGTQNVGVSSKKRILYCIGANELTEHKEGLIKAVSERFEILRQNREKIDTTIFLYPLDKQLWREIDAKLSNDLFNLLESEIYNGIAYTEITPMDADGVAEEYDAYYGSSSPLVPAFVTQKKLVMLANYSITI